jgi:hypothetical protein
MKSNQPAAVCPASVDELRHKNSVVDGRLELRCGNGDDDRITFSARCRIDHASQARELSRDVIVEECLPCLNYGGKRRMFGCIWLALRSELVLCGLHFTAILLETIKNGKNEFTYIAQAVARSPEICDDVSS